MIIFHNGKHESDKTNIKNPFYWVRKEQRRTGPPSVALGREGHSDASRGAVAVGRARFLKGAGPGRGGHMAEL